VSFSNFIRHSEFVIRHFRFMAGHGGGAWKVAYADFVTAMMAFFLVMWITGQSQEVKRAIGGYFQDPWGTSAENTAPSFQNPSGLRGDAPMGNVPQGILPERHAQSNDPNATDEDAGARSVWQQKHRVHLLNKPDNDLPALVVRFDEASADLSTDGQDRLMRLIPALAGKPNLIEIRAHSSRRPLPSGSQFSDHWQLCYERSVAAMRFLEQNGIEPKRVRLSQSSPHEPISRRLESDWQNENDIIEVFLLTEVVEGLPGGDDASKSAPQSIQPSETTPHARGTDAGSQ
jgi:chemotaxis protein MotB